MNARTVLLAGGTGLVGQRLAAQLLADGFEVALLTRRPDPANPFRQFTWDPAAGTLDPAALPWASAVVNLAGSRITAGRWTAARKRAIVRSRLDATGLLVRELSKPGHRVQTLLSASAYGYYGDTGTRPTDERDAPGVPTDFLAHLCQRWELAARPAAQAGVRLVLLRLGLVLSPDDGLLQGLRTAVRLGLGGGFGSGEQFVSWVHVDDVARLVSQALTDAAWQGAYNVTAPHPVPNRQLLATVARVMDKQPGWRVPAQLLRLFRGEMSTLLLGSYRVVPLRALEQGFAFRYPDIEGAIRSLFTTAS